jgi:hypothetical protein
MKMTEKPRLLRREAAKFLTDHGFPTTANSLQKLATVGGGPIYQLFGNRATYRTEDLLTWGESKLSAPRRSTSEAA